VSIRLYLRVEDQLDDPAAITEVDEDDPAVVAPPGDPAAQPDLLADVL